MSPPVSAADRASGSSPAVLHDKLISTNFFDTVSKRSVERYYCPHEPQLLRHFVKKPQRRSPLLNRIYWLRLKTIEHIVCGFISSCEQDAPKVVINLGCGSDVLPWRMNYRLKEKCKDTRFIDVDLPDVIREKRHRILQNPELLELLGSDYRGIAKDLDPLGLFSEKYCQIGCDITSKDILQDAIRPLITHGSRVLVVAEVSLAYSDITSTDQLLDWARDDLKAEFCMLDYCLPAGSYHPFATSLLTDHEKDQTPLTALLTYPTAKTQCQRFRDRGWQSVNSWNLWAAWSGCEFFDIEERDAIDRIEPFDDWEDLILLARHLFVLHASDRGPRSPVPETGCTKSDYIEPRINVIRHDLPKNPRRRSGALLQDRTVEGAELLLSVMGRGKKGLSDSYDALTLTSGELDLHLPTSGPSPRSYFTSSDLGVAGVLVTGGRSDSLDQPLSDCWLYVRGLRPRWKQTWDLPTGLYRHSAARLGRSSMVLLLGGRCSLGVSSASFVFHPSSGWRKCDVEGSTRPSLFGAAAWDATCPDMLSTFGTFQGFICGGLSESGAPSMRLYRWHLKISRAQASIRFELLRSSLGYPTELSLFGATVVTTKSQVMLAGGIGLDPQSNCLGQSVIQWNLSTELPPPSVRIPFSDTQREWPLILGSGAAVSHDHLLVVGGGTSTYRSNSIWTEGLYAMELNFRSLAPGLPNIRLIESPRIITTSISLNADHPVGGVVPLTPIPRIRLEGSEDFRKVLDERKPVIIEGLDFGTCLAKWTPQYLCEKVGAATQVTVHESTSNSPRLDFNSKNFTYATGPFGNVIEKMARGARMYLRALSRSKPSEIPANLEDDFPTLAPDFQLPEELSFAKDSLFSSILRLSGRANMWLHYDVMANIYTQIRGTKQMILFPPRDAIKLEFAPGASSSSFDVFSAVGTEELAGTHPHEATLGEGDALYLPAAWLHTATPLTDMSVAVNVFFRDLDKGYSGGRDVYGNRDLAAYEKGRQDVAKIAQTFRSVPHDMRQFYLSRIAEELLQLANSPQGPD